MRLAGVPIVLSKCASVSIERADIPVRQFPFATDGSNLLTRVLKASSSLPHDIVLVGGVRSAGDMMDDEVVQIVGALAGEVHSPGRRLLILPGLHSKYLVVEGGQGIEMWSYMTGEIINLFTNHSRSGESVDPRLPIDISLARQVFQDGVKIGQAQNLLQGLSNVHAHGVLRLMSPSDNFQYLWGLVLGNELKDVGASECAAILIIASPEVAKRYRLALRLMEFEGEVLEERPEKALLRGQARLAARLGLVEVRGVPIEYVYGLSS